MVLRMLVAPLLVATAHGLNGLWQQAEAQPVESYPGSSKDCHDGLSCRACLTAGCGYYGSCLPSCDMIADVACYEGDAEKRCAAYESSQRESKLCEAASASCEVCTAKTKANGASCRWFADIGACLAEGGMIGPGESVCPQASPPSPSPPQPSPSPPPPIPSPPSPPPPGTFTTKASLQTAVRAFDDNPTAATATYGLIADWDVSAITDMSYLFEKLKNFNADISGWDTSKVTDMYAMCNVRSARALAPKLALSQTFPPRARRLRRRRPTPSRLPARTSPRIACPSFRLGSARRRSTSR